MTSNPPAGTRILGSLRSADGKGVVRMQDRFDTDIGDLWSALTDPRRLARWIAEVEGDLRPGGEFRARFTSGWKGTGRVAACEPPRRLLVVTRASGKQDEQVIEATLAADGDQTILIIEERGFPLSQLADHGAGWQVTSKTSPPTSAGVSAATSRRAGTNSSPPTRPRRPAPASQGRSAAAAGPGCRVPQPRIASAPAHRRGA